MCCVINITHEEGKYNACVEDDVSVRVFFFFGWISGLLVISGVWARQQTAKASECVLFGLFSAIMLRRGGGKYYHLSSTQTFTLCLAMWRIAWVMQRLALVLLESGSSILHMLDMRVCTVFVQQSEREREREGKKRIFVGVSERRRMRGSAAEKEKRERQERKRGETST